MNVTNVAGNIMPDRLAHAANVSLTRKERIELGLSLLKIAKKANDPPFCGLVSEIVSNLNVEGKSKKTVK